MLRILFITLVTLYSLSPTIAQEIAKDTSRTGFPDRLLGSRLSPTADLRTIDGISLGLSYKISGGDADLKNAGSFQKIKALHSLTTKSLVVEYQAEFKDVFRKTDFTMKAVADMQGNIINFFGPGNDTEFDQTGDFRKFYRVNFSFYEFRPALKFKLNNNVSITTGTSIQHFVNGNNENRYFEASSVTSAYNDLYGDKLHGRLFLDFNWDRRDDKLLPTRGINFNFLVQGFEGLNTSSQSFAQAFSQFSFYKSLNTAGTVVFANRFGGGLTTGSPAFYQSAFLGSQDNLLGFRKNRFAGDHVLYNNMEIRITVPNFLQKIMPGKIGLIGTYDAGRVWVKNEKSNTIHHGVGAGVFATPFNKFFIRGIAGYSEDGLQPTVALRQRF